MGELVKRTSELYPPLREAPAPLTRRQRALIDVLTTPPYPSLREAAEIASIPLPTAKRWHSADERFQAELEVSYQQAKSQTKEDMERRIHAMSNLAVRGLAEVITPGLSPAEKRRAGELVNEALQDDATPEQRAAAQAVVENLLKATTTPSMRLKASEIVIDRILGKAAQRNEITGADGGPLAVDNRVFILPAKDLPPDPTME